AQGPEHYGHSRYAPALVRCPRCPQMDLRQEKWPRQATYRRGIGKLVLKLMTKNPSWGSDRIVEALANLHYKISGSIRNHWPESAHLTKTQTYFWTDPYLKDLWGSL